jgi:hypothetical protein
MVERTPRLISSYSLSIRVLRRRITDPPAEYREYGPNARRYRQGCRTGGRAGSTVVVWPPTAPDATPSPAGSAVAQNRRRSSGRRCGAHSRRRRRRRCIHTCRCAHPWPAAADPCRRIRSSVEVPAPWGGVSCPESGAKYWQIKRQTRMTNFPRFRPWPSREAKPGLLVDTLETGAFCAAAGLLRVARNDVDRSAENLTPSLRGALATKQSSLRPETQRVWFILERKRQRNSNSGLVIPAISPAAVSGFPSSGRARSRSAHAPRSGAATARC